MFHTGERSHVSTAGSLAPPAVKDMFNIILQQSGLRASVEGRQEIFVASKPRDVYVSIRVCPVRRLTPSIRADTDERHILPEKRD